MTDQILSLHVHKVGDEYLVIDEATGNFSARLMADEVLACVVRILVPTDGPQSMPPHMRPISRSAVQKLKEDNRPLAMAQAVLLEQHVDGDLPF